MFLHCGMNKKIKQKLYSNVVMNTAYFTVFYKDFSGCKPKIIDSVFRQNSREKKHILSTLMFTNKIVFCGY